MQGWTAARHQSQVRKKPIGFYYAHAAVDAHTRFAEAEVRPDERGATAAGFLTLAAAYFTAHGTLQLPATFCCQTKGTVQ